MLHAFANRFLKFIYTNFICYNFFLVTAAIDCDTKAALVYMRSLFHVEPFENCLPPIILHHQLYSIVHKRTVVDKELVRIVQFVHVFV